MHGLYHLVSYVQKHGFKHKLLFTVSLMIFFFTMADSILTYILPLLLVSEGFSESQMGLIVGSSSAFGAIFDVLLSRYLKRPHYRRLYLAVLLLALMFAWMLYGVTVVWVYLLAMAVWGLYWDLMHFANYDFVSRTAPVEEHAAAFGVMGVFHGLGALTAPILAGIAIGLSATGAIGYHPFALASIFLGIASCFYFLACFQYRVPTGQQEVVSRRKTSWSGELRTWLLIGRQIFPVLVLMLLIFMTDAFFWTIGPLIAEHGEFGALGGLLLTMYSLPVLFVGWFIGSLTKKRGKKRTAIWGLLIGSLVTATLPLTPTPALMIVVVTVAAFFFSLVLPSISGVFVDFISDNQAYEKEIQGLSDFFYNVGWIIGPIVSGFLAQTMGNKESFAVLGVVTALISLVLLKVTPHKIKVKIGR